VYRLDIQLEQYVYFSNHFFVLPLFSVLENLEYYFLTIDEAGPHLYLADKYNFSEITSDDLKSKTLKGIQDFLDIEEVPSYHVEAQGGRNKESVVFHGHGNEKDDREIRMRQLIKSIIKALPKSFSEDKKPLIVAGPTEEVSLFKEYYPYHNLKKTLNFDTQLMKNDELHSKSWEVAGTILEKDRKDTIARYCDLKATDNISNEVTEIVPAAFYGKVDTLFVNAETTEFGEFDPNNGETSISLEEDPADELRNLAAIKTVENNGRVLLLNLSEMPDKTSLNAIFRY
jgi:hypothetical protein